MECFPACKVCTGLCNRVPVQTRARTTPRAIPKKHGWTLLRCNHWVQESEQTLTMLGDGLGAQPWCNRCGDFVPVKKTQKATTTLLGDPLYQLPPIDDPPPF